VAFAAAPRSRAPDARRVRAGDGRARHAQDRPPGADFYRAFHNGPQLAPPFAQEPGAAFGVDTPPQRALASCLQSFVASGRSGAPLSPAEAAARPADVHAARLTAPDGFLLSNSVLAAVFARL
jgi:hypothetical protein